MANNTNFVNDRVMGRLDTRSRCRVHILSTLAGRVRNGGPRGSCLFRSVGSYYSFVHKSIHSFAAIRGTLRKMSIILRLTTRANAKRSVCVVGRCGRIGIVNLSGVFRTLSLGKRDGAVHGIVLSSSHSICNRNRCRYPGYNMICPHKHGAGSVVRNSFAVRYSGYGATLALVPAARSDGAAPGSLCTFAGLSRRVVVRAVYPTVSVSCAVFHFRGICKTNRSLGGPCANVLSVFSSLLLSGGSVGVFRSNGRDHSFVRMGSITSTIVGSVGATTSGKRVVGLNDKVKADIVRVTRALGQVCNDADGLGIANSFHVKSVTRGITSARGTQGLLSFAPSVSLRRNLARFYG